MPPVIRLATILTLLCVAWNARGATPASAALPGAALQELSWRMIGPFRGGRTRALAGVPSQPSVFYVGAVNGGVWMTDDAGRSWVHLGLGNAQQIAALAVDPHDPARLFAAVLGHPYGPSEERGIYRSLDSGATWQRVL